MPRSSVVEGLPSVGTIAMVERPSSFATYRSVPFGDHSNHEIAKGMSRRREALPSTFAIHIEDAPPSSWREKTNFEPSFDTAGVSSIAGPTMSGVFAAVGESRTKMSPSNE